LRFHFSGLECPGELEEPVGERRLPVIDMRDDGKIPDELLIQDAFIMTDGAAIARHGTLMTATADDSGR
jgi:hypothetical protein